MEESMKKLCGIVITLPLLITLAACQKPQEGGSENAPRPAGSENDRPLVLMAAIPLESVKGRFDHFSSAKGLLFVSALGNNSEEIIDLAEGALAHTIKGVPNPQGVAFSSEANKLFVASDEGKLYIYDGSSFKLITTIDFPGGADNLRYDTGAKRLYVACGDDEKTSAIAMVDAVTNKRLDPEYKLGGEPESFQLEKSGPNMYVNIPDLKQIAVINRNSGAIARWDLTLNQNFPMALDEADHRLFVGTREPARLAVFDTTSGHMIAALPSVEDTDDLYYDASRKRIYIPGGEGSMYVFHQDDPDHYHLMAKIPTALGARTAGYFGRQRKGFDRFYLAVPAHSGQNAEIWVYTVRD
jgi:hypothetical protein